MIDFSQIQKQYPNTLHRFERGMLREYLQYQILSLIYKHSIGRKLSFLGGTNLRIVHNLPRFSEDIDFDNKNLTEKDFQTLSLYLGKELEKLGYEVEIKVINKGVFRLDIKFPHLLFTHGLSPLEEEKILIQVDSFDQGIVYHPEVFVLNKFEFFDQILVTPKSVILSQKLWTITQRKRFKGRDFFDIMFLLQHTQPDLDFLEAKFSSRDLEVVKSLIFEHLKKANFDELAVDVKPFLHTPQDSEKIKLFEQFLDQQL